MICLLSRQSTVIPFQMYRSSHTWVIYWVTAAAWTAKSSTVLKLLLLPSADWQNVSSSITTLLKWPFTEQSVSQLCCTGVRHGPSIDDMSRPSRHFTSAKSAKHPWHPMVAENTTHWALGESWNNTGWTLAPPKTTAMAGACYQNAWQPAASSVALRWAHCGTAFSWSSEKMLHRPHQSKSPQVQH